MLTLKAVLLLVAVPAALAWVNDWDRPVRFECPSRMFLSNIGSSHNNRAEDRRWNFGCRALPAGVSRNLVNCGFTTYLNDWDQPLAFMCPNNGIVTGIHSIHNNKAEDRRTQLKCCQVSGAITYNCQFSTQTYNNEFDQSLFYQVPHGKVLTGMHSYHNNRMEDRRHKFIICNIKNN